MRRLRLRRPSPAMVVSLIALFFALGGGAYALTLPANSVGPSQLRRSAVLNSKMFPGTVSNSKMGRGAVTFSKMASNQMTSEKIRNGSLLGEDMTANTITGAQINESTLGITKWALVSGGSIVASSGGVSVGAEVGNTTFVNFGSSMAGRPILATLSATASPASGEVAAAPCGGASTANPGAITCAGSLNTPDVVAVSTFGSDGVAASRPFYLAIPQA